MWRSKKVIVGAVLAVVVLFSSFGGVALAQTGNAEDGKMAKYQALLDRVCVIYQEKTDDAIDQEVLKNTVWQVIKWTRSEALQDRVQKWVDNGCIEQEKADKAVQWFESKPRFFLKTGIALKIYEWKTGDSIDRRAFVESIVQAVKETRAE
jgi:hypothetical protein